MARKLTRRLAAGIAAFTLSAAIFTAAPIAHNAFADTESADASTYLVGTGIYDVTGAVVETGSFGYASGQEMTGLHERLYSHTFIVGDPETKDRVVLVSVDTGAIFPNIRLGVLEKLKQKYGDLYNSNNVLISATHTHVGNGGMAVDELYRIASNDGAGYNYDQRIVDTMIAGIVASIERAHNNLQPGTIQLQQGELKGATKNRSLPGYNANPDAGNYADNVSTGMTQLAFKSESGKPLGVLNWFSTHPTSFNIHWTLISGDNKGYAQYMFEKKMGSDPADPHAFVAAFANSATGDVVAAQGNSVSAPGFEGLPDDYQNAEIAGQQQLDKAVELFNAGGKPLHGRIDSRTRYVKMPGYAVHAPYTSGEGEQKLCVSARGFSFAPGGENGPSNIPGVYEGMTKGTFNVFDTINKIDQSFAGTIVRLVGKTISLGDDPCQAEKPILVPDGKIGWTPTVLPVQIVRIGNLAVLGLPIEATTMSARHMKESVAKILADDGVDTVELSGPANGYAGYLTTRAEYATQQYEGASTEFGPHELGAFMQELDGLSHAMIENKPVVDDALPTLPNTKLWVQRPGVVLDDKPAKEEFGQVLVQPHASYTAGDTARAEFRGAHPKNNFRTLGTFLRVQRLENGVWVDYLTDRDWDTSFIWKREGVSYSRTTVEWRIRNDTPAGTYRLVQEGDWKNGWNGVISPYSGASQPFEVR
ncbi:neutral ceramidase [Arcanobacterium pluranimalium]|uniref:neutral/alkaline non-lysosomal ceramidase N-terminal domain-containing protein n=1 Tax=Arcanobacterium pluranimalium TaxID=108028 RepID=UPI001957E590|nr:neutral/alkaline non-lysosomal ceramidase N-terminal domain-containing protein [Arcanobacterium pluranimalium]MBM7824338.1 neutral ceramidase [Arcanobacterium pluranimalium]